MASSTAWWSVGCLVIAVFGQGDATSHVKLSLNQDLQLEQRQQQLLQQEKQQHQQQQQQHHQQQQQQQQQSQQAQHDQNQSTESPWKPGDPITNSTVVPLKAGVNYLHQMLQMCIEVEHSVIPPYLTALYSLKPDGTDDESWMGETLLGIVIEEMLHMTIAANTLNAVGGSPAIDRVGFVPDYPMQLPALNITVGIEPMSYNQSIKFRAIELPLNATAAALKYQVYAPNSQPDSISAVYGYVIKLMTALCAQHGEKNVFTGDPAAQISVMSPRTGESVSKILNISDAVTAMLEVVHQGAGLSDVDINPGPLGGEFAHFARFEEMYKGQMYQTNDTVASGPTGKKIAMNWTTIYQFKPNPVPENYPVGSKERAMLLDFAGNYTSMLSSLHEVFNGSPTTYYTALEKMYSLATMAKNLMQTPDPRFDEKSGVMLGPAWLWLQNKSTYADTWTGYSPQPPHAQWGC